MKQLQTTLANIIILFGCVIVCLSLTINDDIRAIRSILMGSSLALIGYYLKKDENP